MEFGLAPEADRKHNHCGDQQHGDNAAGPTRGNGALLLAAGGLPDGGLHNAAPVQRKPRQDVEYCHQEIGHYKDICQQRRDRVSLRQRYHECADAGERKVGRRTRHGHYQGLSGGSAEILELGVAAPQIQDDLGRGPLVGTCG